MRKPGSGRNKVVVWIDGLRCESMTDIYCELKAHTAEAMKKVRECITEETPYKGRVIRQTPPSEHSGKRNTGGQGLSLLPKLCTHRLGYNSGRW